jgi:serine phosphatase RsbU (regulator of sigma subunit)
LQAGTALRLIIPLWAIEALRRNRGLSSQCLMDSIVAEVQKFSPQEQHDDITLIIAKHRGN